MQGKRGKITIDQPYITIAGQTAPGEGICLKNGCLDIKAGEVIVRHIRSRRGFIADGDSGDSLTVKPEMKKATGPKAGTDPEQQKKIEEKKKERGKDVKMPAVNLENILLDHISASWSTDENLSVTHPNWTTAQFCIMSEGLDYANPKQTPPRHSEGSLWGVSAPDGRSTFHHNLYAHNRLRNPRTTGGDSPFAVLEFRNNVVYNASENFSHTGGGTVYLNWFDNYYKAGPSTPASLKGSMFEFVHSKDSRMYASGNVIEGYPEVERDNWKGVRYGKGLTEKDGMTLRVDKPFPAPAMAKQSARDGCVQVLEEAGATLPARDSVDLRIVDDVRNGTGKIIDKETDLPPEQRWPTYHALPAPKDSDADGIPDFWEEQFGLNKNDPKDSKAIGHGGYANIEHYFNNTDPTGGSAADCVRLRSGDAGTGKHTRHAEGDADRQHATAIDGALRYRRLRDCGEGLREAIRHGHDPRGSCVGADCCEAGRRNNGRREAGGRDAGNRGEGVSRRLPECGAGGCAEVIG